MHPMTYTHPELDTSRVLADLSLETFCSRISQKHHLGWLGEIIHSGNWEDTNPYSNPKSKAAQRETIAEWLLCHNPPGLPWHSTVHEIWANLEASVIPIAILQCGGEGCFHTKAITLYLLWRMRTGDSESQSFSQLGLLSNYSMEELFPAVQGCVLRSRAWGTPALAEGLSRSECFAVE